MTEAVSIPTDRLCRCANCGHKDDSEDISLYDVSDLNDRLDPGCTVPAGECSSCGCLTYLVAPRQEERGATLLRQAATAIEGLDDACRNDQEHRDLIGRLRAEADDRHGADAVTPASPAVPSAQDRSADMAKVIALLCGYFADDADLDAGLQQIVQSAHALARDLHIQPSPL